MKKHKNNGKCKIEWCSKKAHANGLCSSHNHFRHKSADFGGAYKVELNDYIYAGKSDISIETRMNDEKSGLRTNNPAKVSKELLDHFNYVCKKEFGEENYLDKKLRNKVIERMKFEPIIERYPFLKADGSVWEDKEEMKERVYMWHIKYKDGKLDEEAKEWYEKYVNMIDVNETIQIRKYKKEDIKNDTQRLLNKNKLKNKK